MTRILVYIAIAAVAGCVACVLFAAIASAAPGTIAQPLPQLYLPLVQRDMPPMSAEFTPVHPAPTVTPEVSGDVAR